nr:putative late blight resistance protein homolog R1B-14 [Ipomoea batatas]
MADAAISLLVNRLAQVVEENATLILGIRDHVEELVSDLNSFQAILKQASKHESSNDNDVLRDVVDKIRSVVNEAEDAIDKYLVDTRKHKSKGTVMRYLDKVAYYSKASDAAKQIDAIKGRVAKIRKDHDSGLRELQRDPNEAQLFLQRKAPVVEEDDVVGFDEEAKTIKDHKKPSGENIRSFLSSSSKEVEVSNEFWTTIPKAFPTLRVLDIEYLKFQVLSKEFYHLYYLRYLAISTDLKILPKQFNNLWNMQTLVFKTSQNTIEVKADIWSLTKLRHVLINASAQLPPPSKSSKPSSLAMDLQTLSTISPSSCTEEIFARIPNLQKLGIRGNLSELLESRGGSCLFDNIRSLDHLENLKLLHDASIGQASKLRSIPRAEKFPRKLRKLTLSSTSFEWKDMYILGSLEELEILKLEENAFRGEFLDLSNVSFKHLQLLRMGRTDLVSWTASKNSFPVLKYLHLRHCANLDAVPPAFAEIESLRVVELFCTNTRAAISAREIFKQKQEKENTERSGTFVFSIYPPDQ